MTKTRCTTYAFLDRGSCPSALFSELVANPFGLASCPWLNLRLASPTVGTLSSFISISALLERLLPFLTGFLYVAR